MNKKQNLIGALLLVTSTLVSFCAADRIDNVLPIQEVGDNACPNMSKVYLNQDNDNDHLADFGLYLNSNFILQGSVSSYSAGKILMTNNNTMVKYHLPLPNMIYKTNSGQVSMLDDYTFYRASFVFPYNTPVRGIATTPNKIIFEQPSDNDPNKNTVGFIYDYRYVYATSFNGSSTYAYRYNEIPSMNYMLNTGLSYTTTLPGSNGNRLRSWSATQPALSNDKICKNYELHRCGDGKIQTPDSSYVNYFTGEVCDEGSLNGTPGHCNATCSGTGGGLERCGDNILQPAGTNYNGDTNTPSFEECDDGDLTGDNGDGILNGDDPNTAFCSTICLPNFSEAFTEEFVNG